MNKKKCSAENCDKERYGLKEYCRRHYLQIKKYGVLTPKLEVNKILKGDVCSIESCEKLVYSKKLCHYHWSLQRREIKQKEFNINKKISQMCKVDECDDIIFCKGYCMRHYNQIQKHGKIILIERKIKYPKICTVEGCDNKTESLGYCNKHYQRFIKYGNPLYLKPKYHTCQIEGCNNKYYAKGYCQKHYTEYIRTPKDRERRKNKELISF